MTVSQLKVSINFVHFGHFLKQNNPKRAQRVPPLLSGKILPNVVSYLRKLIEFTTSLTSEWN